MRYRVKREDEIEDAQDHPPSSGDESDTEVGRIGHNKGRPSDWCAAFALLLGAIARFVDVLADGISSILVVIRTGAYSEVTVKPIGLGDDEVERANKGRETTAATTPEPSTPPKAKAPTPGRQAQARALPRPRRRGTSTVDGQASPAHLPQRPSLYAVEIIDGIIPPLPLSPPPVPAGHDGCFYAVTVGRRVGVFPYWEEVNALVKRVPGNSYKKYATYDDARDAFEMARLLDLVWETNN